MNDTPTPRTDALRTKLHESINTPNIVKYMETVLHANELETELTAAWENIAQYAGTNVSLNIDLHLAKQDIVELTEQRDRLAENLKQIYNVSSFDYDTMPEAARKKYREIVFAIADKALQSLTEKLT